MQLRRAAVFALCALVATVFLARPSYAAITTTTVNYTSNTTFSATSDMLWVYVEAWGGGGSGGGRTLVDGRAGGGGGGAYAAHNFTTGLSAASYNIRIGPGGTGTSGAGQDGGTTYFGNGTNVAARGGSGGLSTGAGGSGGSTALSNGTTEWAGGNGGTGDATCSAGGGGGAGSTQAGSDGAAGIGAPGGDGGTQHGGKGGSGTCSGGSGNPGSNFGAGGGGAERQGSGSPSGGNGAQGLIRITYAKNSCSYPGSGNWVVDCTDACTIASNTDLAGKNITLSGTGAIGIAANITNVKWAFLYGSCRVTVTPAGSLRFNS